MPANVADLLALSTKLYGAQELIDSATPRILKEVAEAIATDARALAPMATGALRGSIKVRAGKKTATVMTSLRYAAYNEFGTSRMPPTPFFQPATDAHENDVPEALEELIARVLR